MANTESDQGLNAAIEACYNSHKYTDLTIRCHERTFRVHKLVVCGQSDFFANAVKDGAFQEGETNCVDMKVDDPDAVAALLDFLYLRDYKIPDAAPEQNHSATSDSKPDEGASSEEVHSNNPILFHLKVYALAERILYQPLKALVEKKFETAATENWNSPEFPLAVESVYDVAPPGVRGDCIRGIVLDLAAKHARDLFTKENGKQFSEMMEKNAEFGKDLAMTLSGCSSTTIRGRSEFTCPNCSFKFLAVLPEGYCDYLNCAICRCNWDVSDWLRT